MFYNDLAVSKQKLYLKTVGLYNYLCTLTTINITFLNEVRY